MARKKSIKTEDSNAKSVPEPGTSSTTEKSEDVDKNDPKVSSPFWFASSPRASDTEEEPPFEEPSMDETIYESSYYQNILQVIAKFDDEANEQTTEEEKETSVEESKSRGSPKKQKSPSKSKTSTPTKTKKEETGGSPTKSVKTPTKSSREETDDFFAQTSDLFSPATEEELKKVREQAQQWKEEKAKAAAEAKSESDTLASKVLSPRRRNLECTAVKFNTITRLFAYTGNMPIEMLGISTQPASNRILNGSDLEKPLKWAKQMAPELLWSPVIRKASQNIEEWKAFEIVHQVTTNCAYKCMSMFEKVMRPGEQVTYGGQKFNGFCFLKEFIGGLLLTSKRRKEIPFEIVNEILDKFYTCGFKSVKKFNQLKKKTSRRSSSEKLCSMCTETVCVCESVATLFLEANMALHGLGLVEELAGPRLHSVIQKQIEERVKKCDFSKLDTSHLNSLLPWLEANVAPWIETIYPLAGTKAGDKQGRAIFAEFQHMLFEIYGKGIISNLFNIVIEFPDSSPILDDLKKCMKEVNLRCHLVFEMTSSLMRRLLNAGVNTSNILVAYISCVRALKYLDPSGILVQLVSPPVRTHLKEREETVRVILVSLTEEAGDLAEELARHPASAENSSKLAITDWKNWEPDPIDVPKDTQNLRKSDLIQALVSIYGSKSVFIDEYRALLADRLLRMSKPGSMTREIKCLELLKLRFGESDLQKCEVMLKDVADSQRLNTRFYEEEGAVLSDLPVPLTALTVSAQFWPLFNQEELQLPDVIEDALERYTKAFEAIKGNRTLEWQKHIGHVELELEIGNNTHTLTVNPSHASIIWQFQDQDTWSLTDLSEKTKIPPSVLKNKIGFWISKGIISQDKDTYVLNKNADVCPDTTTESHFPEETEPESLIPSTSSLKETELQMFWSYIEGMLTNLDSLPLDRIHSMLKLFATVECSEEELQTFLDGKVQQGLLMYSAGQYQLPK